MCSSSAAKATVRRPGICRTSGSGVSDRGGRCGANAKESGESALNPPLDSGRGGRPAAGDEGTDTDGGGSSASGALGRAAATWEGGPNTPSLPSLNTDAACPARALSASRAAVSNAAWAARLEELLLCLEAVRCLLGCPDVDDDAGAPFSRRSLRSLRSLRDLLLLLLLLLPWRELLRLGGSSGGKASSSNLCRLGPAK